MKRQSTMAHNTAQIPKANIPRSSFDRSHGKKLTMNAGDIIPVLMDEAYPGDTFRCNPHGKVRLSSPLYDPIMDNMRFTLFFFSIPERLIWENAQKFYGEQENPGDSIDFNIPTTQIPANALTDAPLHHYLYETPATIPRAIDVSSLYARAYYKVYNDWFRDGNLQQSLNIDIDNGPDNYSDYVIQKRGKRHDYFTSCLPWPQRHDAQEVLIAQTATIASTGDMVFDDGAGNTGSITSPAASIAANVTNLNMDGSLEYVSGLEADLSASGGTINQLRQSIMVQQMYETDARGGARYIEIVKAHFNVTSPDLRATRAQFLGSATVPINVHQVAATNEGGSVDLADLGAFVEASFSKSGFTHSFTEHCIVLGVACIDADLTYQQGINRQYLRSDRLDKYWPKLARIGEQAVTNDEIYVAATDDSGNQVFGYQERYAELRYKPSTILGELNSTHSFPLDTWHLSEEFATPPKLNADFIESNPPISRVSRITTQDYFIADLWFEYICARPLPLFGVPGALRF